MSDDTISTMSREDLESEYLDLSRKFDSALLAERQLQEQIDRLADFIVEEVQGEPSESEGVVDTAIRTIKQLQEALVRIGWNKDGTPPEPPEGAQALAVATAMAQGIKIPPNMVGALHFGPPIPGIHDTKEVVSGFSDDDLEVEKPYTGSGQP